MAPRHHVRDVIQETDGIFALHIEFEIAVSVADDLTCGVEQLVVDSVIFRVEQMAFENDAHRKQTIVVVGTGIDYDVAHTHARLRNNIDVGCSQGLIGVLDSVGCCFAQNANSERVTSLFAIFRNVELGRRATILAICHLLAIQLDGIRRTDTLDVQEHFTVDPRKGHCEVGRIELFITEG